MILILCGLMVVSVSMRVMGVALVVVMMVVVIIRVCGRVDQALQPRQIGAGLKIGRSCCSQSWVMHKTTCHIHVSELSNHYLDFLT